LWRVPDERRAAVVESLVQRLDSDERELFAVATQAQAIAFLAAEART